MNPKEERKSTLLFEGKSWGEFLFLFSSGEQVWV
jgi:hypothetical protein